MNEDAKKTALRMIPYGMYVLTTKSKASDEVDAATVNWVTQTSFNPPLVAVGVKADSKTHQFVKDTNVFAVNVISGEQINTAFTFFKTQEREGDSIGGEQFELGTETGCPLLLNAQLGGNVKLLVKSLLVIIHCLLEKWWKQEYVEKRTRS